MIVLKINTYNQLNAKFYVREQSNAYLIVTIRISYKLWNM